MIPIPQYNFKQSNKFAQFYHKVNSSLKTIHSFSDTFEQRIHEVVNMGFIPILVSFLKKQDNPDLQFESTWALTNIASGTSEHVQQLIQAGAVKEMIPLLNSPHMKIREQALWFLGNIAGDSRDSRDYILSTGVLDTFIKLIHEAKTIRIIQFSAWVISNVVRGKPQPDFKITSKAIPTLAKLLSTYTDEQILADVCWAISFLSDGPNERVEAVIKSGCVPKLVELLS
jgi:importin subunit alpha-1